MARHSDQGDEVAVLFMTNGVGARGEGECDSQNADLRTTALVSALQIVGARLLDHLSWPDNEMDTVPLLKIARSHRSPSFGVPARHYLHPPWRGSQPRSSPHHAGYPDRSPSPTRFQCECDLFLRGRFQHSLARQLDSFSVHPQSPRQHRATTRKKTGSLECLSRRDAPLSPRSLQQCSGTPRSMEGIPSRGAGRRSLPT